MYWIGLIIVILNLLIGRWVILDKKRSGANWLFFIFTVSIAGWIFSVISAIAEIPPSVLFWGRMAMPTSIIGIASLFLFAVTFPEKDKLPRNAFFITLVPAVFFCAVSFTDLMIVSARTTGSYLIGTFGPLMNVYYFIYPSVFILGAIAILLKKYFSMQGVKKEQLRWVLFGLAFTFIPGLVTNVIFPLFGVFVFNGTGPFFVIITSLFTAYAILKLDFMGLGVIIQRGLLFTLGSFILFGIYFGSVIILNYFMSSFNYIPSVGAILTAFIGAFGYPYLRSYFFELTDPVFFRGDYNYNKTIKELSEITSSTIEIDNLLKAVENLLLKSIRPDKIIFLMDDAGENADLTPEIRRIFNRYSHHSELITGEELAESGVSAIVPVFYENKVIAWIILGLKVSGDSLSQKDCDLLNIISHQAGLAIQNARLYAKIKLHGEQLEKKVAERTRELQNLNESQSRFLAEISHELQTPISIIKINAELLREGKFKERGIHIDTIERTTDRMSRLISDLLSLARMDSGAIIKKPVAMDALLQEIYDDFLILAKNKNINLSLKNTGAVVIGESDKLKQAFLNILSNALKYTSENGEISIISEIADGFVRVIIKDNGEGISPEDMPRIFDRFYRDSKKSDFAGTGLGLPICRQIIELHGGKIEAKSIPGEGAEFIIRIPLANN